MELQMALKGKAGGEDIERALVSLNHKYHQIDEDPARNFSYLDPLILENGAEKGQEKAQ
jgi:hypothetical protein